MFTVSPFTLVALTTAYLAVSAVIAAFYIVIAEGPRYRSSAFLALVVIACSGSLAVQLWSTRSLWGG